MGDHEGMRLFHTGDHACGYWPERVARDLVLDPRDTRLAEFYGQALSRGFRRSGDIVYRPHCRGCHACQPVRIDVQAFRPNRTQRRCLARNADVEARVVPATGDAERLALYTRYLRARHAGGGMDDHGAAEFEQFLVSHWAQSRFLELRVRGELLAVAVTDKVEHALSAVYTFYDPDAVSRSPGTLAVLRQIDWARREGYAHLYLGYWIEGHDKMDYKRRFDAIERFDGRAWRRMDDAGDAT